MVDSETMRKLRVMKMGDMAEAIEEIERLTAGQSLTYDETTKMVVDRCYSKVSTRQIERRIQAASLRYPGADLKDVIYTPNRNLSKELVNEFICLNFMEAYMSVILVGPAGSGKTWIASAIGKQACRGDKKVLYCRTSALLDELSECRGQIKRSRLMKKLGTVPLLILDEWLLTDLNSEGIMTLLDILDERYDKFSTVFCSQYDVEDWHVRLGGGVQADSVMDRIVHNSIHLNLGEENMRALNSRRMSDRNDNFKGEGAGQQLHEYE